MFDRFIMEAKESTIPQTPPLQPPIIPLSNQKKGICVAMPVSGKPIKIAGDSPTEFIPILKDASIAWLNFPVEDMSEAEKIAISLGFSSTLVPTLLSSYYSAYEDRDTEMGLMFPAVIIKKLEVLTSPLLILVRKDLVLTIHEREVFRLIRFSRYADTFMRKIKPNAPSQDKLTIVLTRIIDEINSRNFDYLREIETQGDELSRHLLDPVTPRATLGPEIYHMKHALITYLDTLWATLDVINSLRYGDAELITDSQKLLARIGILADDVNRQIALGEHMSEVLASGLEVLQSIYNNQLQILNNRLALVMTWLTILGTAVLVPNTIATIFSNPAFNLQPSDTGWYTSLLIGSTILSTCFAYWWIKRKGLMPQRID